MSNIHYSIQRDLGRIDATLIGLDKDILRLEGSIEAVSGVVSDLSELVQKIEGGKRLALITFSTVTTAGSVVTAFLSWR